MVGLGARRAPNTPSRRINHVAYRSFLKHNTSVLAPWAAEIIRSAWNVGIIRCSYGTVVDHVVAGVVGRATRRSDEAERCLQHSNVAPVEPCGRPLAEDEVGSAFDVAFGVQLSASLCEDCILVSVESASVVALVLIARKSVFCPRRVKRLGCLRKTRHTSASAEIARAWPSVSACPYVFFTSTLYILKSLVRTRSVAVA